MSATDADAFIEATENPDEAKERIDEQDETMDERREEARQEQAQQTASNATTQEWLETEEKSDTEIIPFRGRDFEWTQPGIIHKKKMIALASEMDDGDFEDIDPADSEAVDDAIEETFDAEGLKSVDELYEHTLRALAHLCMDDMMGDTSNIPEDVSPLESEELPAGASQWGRLPEDDKEDEDGDVIKEGISSLFARVVMERGLDVDDSGNR